MSRQERRGLASLSDFMGEDILATPGDKLMREVAEDGEDPEVLASAFDRIASPLLSQRRASTQGTTVIAPLPQRAGSAPSSPGAARRRGILTLLGSIIFPSRTALAAISATCAALVAVTIAVPLLMESRLGPPEALPPTPQRDASPAPSERAAVPDAAAPPKPLSRRPQFPAPDERLPAQAAPPDPRMAELDRAIAANPRDGTALVRRGEMFVLRGDYPTAIKDFDEAIRLRPGNVEALNNRCFAHTLAGDLQSALSDCNTALQLRPRYADAFDSRGTANLKAGRFTDAIADYDSALRINPKLATSLYGRGIARIRTGDSAEGGRDVADAKALQPNIAEEFERYGIR
jgi:hypothetical protein